MSTNNFKGCIIQIIGDEARITPEDGGADVLFFISEQEISEYKDWDYVEYFLDSNKKVSIVENFSSTESPPPFSENTSSINTKLMLTSRKNFLVVFNPLFNKPEDMEKEKFKGETQAHCFYKLLKSNIENGIDHSWWGKLKAPNIKDFNFEKYREEFLKNQQSGSITNLFISDFNNLWVARVEDVVDTISDSEAEKTLYFYQRTQSEKPESIEIWFKIIDFKLLSSSNRETYKYMENFEVPDLGIDSFNPYLCNIRYPLVLRDKSGELYFEKETDIKLRSIVREENVLVDSSGREKEVKERIHSYLIPELIFEDLPVSARGEVLLAEALYMELIRDSSLKEEREKQIFLHYSKAFEIVLNDIIYEGHSTGATLGDIVRDIENYVTEDDSHLDDLPEQLATYLGKLSRFLKPLMNLRNPLMHGSDIHLGNSSFQLFMENTRKLFLGIGSEGIISCLYLFKDPQKYSSAITTVNKTLKDLDFKKLSIESKKSKGKVA